MSGIPHKLVEVRMKVTKPVVDALERLATTGLFAPSGKVEDVAERLLCEKIRELVEQGLERK